MNTDRCDLIRHKLTTAFQPAMLNVLDQSHLHIGHAGNTGKKGHFAIEIKATIFDNKTRLEAHRAIYEALGEMMINDIHALSIKIL